MNGTRAAWQARTVSMISVSRFGEHDGTWPRAVGRQTIGLVRRQRAGAREQPVGRNEPRERREEGPRGPCPTILRPTDCN